MPLSLAADRPWSADIIDLSAARERRTAGIRYTVLGPVRAWRGETELELGSPQQRAVLAALLLREGAMATVDELSRAVWGDDSPRTAVSTIRTYVSRLRGILGGAITSVGGGYAVQVPADCLDLARFRRHVDRARLARRSGEHGQAVDELAAAVELRQGQPLAGVPGPYARAQRDRLTELLTGAAIDRLAAEVELGRDTDAIPELTALLAEFPLREQLYELLMIALYRAGRQAEALGQYRAARRILADELGIDPGPALRRVHEQILTADQALPVKGVRLVVLRRPAPHIGTTNPRQPGATAPRPRRRR
ncbi:AfsR/SARP family transcriptional regulator [Winogradskya humida]|uniref:OmpR/PhoB-type domain-containing protein n=1 Tax=Winogradskya humida TaxID=113566 RepID=A0ABQ3ZP18_9ACTN|nr:BTAD domain-containing putative transcriptional regulator [Actinoplanes humidus]GIE20306.1 hypothetical protein Ahu01nite_034080 [Actinoplanes humidus]